MSRRRDAYRVPKLIASGSALVLLATSVSLSAPAAAAPAAQAAASATSSFARSFAAADSSKGAMFRWWWPSSVEAGTAVTQLEAVAKAGYKGVEIAFVMDGTDYVVDPNEYEYGDANWRSAVKAVLTRANQLGVQVDLTLGGRWPAAIPGLDVASDAASQELVTARAVVAGGETFSGDAPAPSARTYGDRTVEDDVVVTTTKTSAAHLVSAIAVECADDCSEPTPVVDLNSSVPLEYSAAGTIDWTAPAGGTWVVVAGWQRGTAQRNDAPFGTTVSPLSAPESRVINHFDSEGTSAFIRWFNRTLDPQARRLLAANGGSIFEDSLELRGALLWTSGFADAFADQHGYDLVPFLPAIAYAEPGSPFAPKIAQFAVPEGQATQLARVRHDVDTTLEQLWTTQHVEPITEWANGLGLTFRAQPYGESIDLGAAASALDISECESLGCSEQQFRTLSAGVALAGKKLVSSEMLPGGFGNLYGLTPAQIAALANREYAFGANQMVFHGLPYPTIPPSADGTITDSAAQWPGFHGFGSNIGEAFGPRQATWTMETDLADYYARMQQTLQAGSARWDVAVLNTESGEGGASTDGAFLDDAGYSYGYVTPGSLADQPVRSGRLDPDGAAFAALVVGSEPLDLDTAKQIERVAKAGLPVIVLDGGPTRAPGWAGTAAAAASEDRAVRSTINRVLALPKSFEADDEDEALVILGDGGIRAAAAVDEGVKVVQRRSGSSTFYVLINRTDAAITTDAVLTGESTSLPFRLDPWTGAVKPVGVSSRTGVRTTVRDVTIEAGGSAIIALASRSFAPGAEAKRVTSTTALDARYANGRVTVIADDSGSFTARLSNGKKVTARITGVPKKSSLTDWTLVMDEWLPGDEGDSSSTTKHVKHTLDSGASLWNGLEGLEDAVGVGSYRTTVTASKSLAAVSAVLDLGDVGGSYRVWVNGKRVTIPDQLGTRVDLGSALRPGTNTIRVDIASTLLNRLRITRPAEFAARTPTPNGLAGPVTLDPYKTVSVRE